MTDQNDPPEEKSQTQRTSILTDEDYEVMAIWDEENEHDDNRNGFTELNRDQWNQVVTMMMGSISTKH